MAYVVLTARAIEIDNGTNPTQLYPYARIKYGNGNVLAENLLDVTGGWMESVVGSTFEMEVFLADENLFPPEAGSGAYAKVQGWGCVGITPYPQRNTQFYDATGAGPTAIVTGCDGQAIQGRITDIDGFVVGASATPSYLTSGTATFFRATRTSAVRRSSTSSSSIRGRRASRRSTSTPSRSSTE